MNKNFIRYVMSGTALVTLLTLSPVFPAYSADGSTPSVSADSTSSTIHKTHKKKHRKKHRRHRKHKLTAAQKAAKEKLAKSGSADKTSDKDSDNDQDDPNDVGGDEPAEIKESAGPLAIVKRAERTLPKFGTKEANELSAENIPSGWNANVIGVGPKEQEKQQPTSTIKETNTQFTDSTKIGENDNSAPHVLVPPHSQNRILIPVNGSMGIAAYQTGDKLIIVVDTRQPMDISALHGDGIFSNAGITTLPGFTMITLPAPDTRKLYMSKQSNGWVLGDKMPPGVDYADRPEINPLNAEGNVLFPMQRSGRVLSIKDPVSNTPLTIGTTVMDDGGILSLRKGKDYDVWPTIEGVVIADHTGKNELLSIPQGDLLKRLDNKDQNDLDKAVYASSVDLEWLGLRNLSDEKANERYNQAVRDAADAPPKDKFAKRAEAAKAALGAYDFHSAQAIMDTALSDDPEEATRPDIRFLLNVVNFMNHNYKDSEGLIQEWPEENLRATKLWKGLYLAAINKDNPEAARLLSRDYDRLLNYPNALRDTLLPLASETIARFGTPEQKKALDKMPINDDRYDFSRALIKLSNGENDKAIHEFESLSGSRDNDIMEKAIEAGIGFSLKTGVIAPDKAEEQYASILPDAKLNDRDGIISILRADADIKSGQFSKALSALDAASQTIKGRNSSDISNLYGDTLDGIGKKIAATTNEDVKATEIVRDAALISSHINDMPPSPQKVDMMVTYAKTLSKLGLDEQAENVITSAIGINNVQEKNIDLADLLAETQIKRGQYGEAEKTINNSTTKTPLPKEENSKRSRMLADIAAETGKPEVALMLLNAYSDPESALIKARINEEKGNWKDAIANLKPVVNSKIQDVGILTSEQQILALRIASDASRAGDANTLAWIKKKVSDRSFNGNDGQLFKLLVDGGQ